MNYDSFKTHPAALFRARDAVLTTSPSAKTALRLMTLSRMVPYLHV